MRYYFYTEIVLLSSLYYDDFLSVRTLGAVQIPIILLGTNKTVSPSFFLFRKWSTINSLRRERSRSKRIRRRRYDSEKTQRVI